MNQDIVTSSALSEYNPLAILPQVFTIIVILAILVIFSLCYFFQVRKLKPNEVPNKFIIMVDTYIDFIEGLILEILGPKFRKLTPYFLYLFTYIILCNTIGIIGLENPTNSLTVTFSMGLVTFIGIFVVGIKFQKLSFFNKFFFHIKKYPIMINPLEIISQVTPLISISFRLWGNIFAGAMIVNMWFYLMGYITSSVPVLSTINLLAGFTIPPIHMYFDLLCGIIQALVFCLLTMVYWTLAKESEHGHSNEKAKLKAISPNLKKVVKVNR